MSAVLESSLIFLVTLGSFALPGFNERKDRQSFMPSCDPTFFKSCTETQNLAILFDGVSRFKS